MARNIKKHDTDWLAITSNMQILSTVKDGLSKNFKHIPEARCPFGYCRNPKEIEAINKEITKLLSKGVIMPTTAEND